MNYAALLDALKAEQDKVQLNKAHRYRADGQYWPGVTTVVRVLDAPQLDDWKVRVQVEGTARAAHANPPRPGEDPEIYVGRLIEVAEEYEHQRLADAAADVGKQVHSLIEHAIKGTLGIEMEQPQVTEEAHFVFAGWKEWADADGFVPLASESRVINRSVGYCGTVDSIALVKGRLTVVDWKPQAALYVERRLQLTAYQKALEDMGWPPMDRAVVAMPRDGQAIKLVPLDDDPESTFDAFKACLRLYQWQAGLRRAEKQRKVA